MAKVKTVRQAIAEHLANASLELAVCCSVLALHRKDKKGDPDWDRLSHVLNQLDALWDIYKARE